MTSIHREAAYREIGTLIEAVLENPVGGHEYADLRLLAEVVLAAPVGVELVGVEDYRAGGGMTTHHPPDRLPPAPGGVPGAGPVPAGRRRLGRRPHGPDVHLHPVHPDPAGNRWVCEPCHVGHEHLITRPAVLAALFGPDLTAVLAEVTYRKTLYRTDPRTGTVAAGPSGLVVVGLRARDRPHRGAAAEPGRQPVRPGGSRPGPARRPAVAGVRGLAGPAGRRPAAARGRPPHPRHPAAGRPVHRGGLPRCGGSRTCE